MTNRREAVFHFCGRGSTIAVVFYGVVPAPSALIAICALRLLAMYFLTSSMVLAGYRGDDFKGQTKLVDARGGRISQPVGCDAAVVGQAGLQSERS